MGAPKGQWLVEMVRRGSAVGAQNGHPVLAVGEVSLVFFSPDLTLTCFVTFYTMQIGNMHQEMT